MKKLFLLLLFVGVAGLTAQAQSCHGTKKASAEAKAVSQDQSPEVLAAAEKAAEADENIEKRVCEKSGKVSFVRKYTCEKSGKVSYKAVVFDAEKGVFTDAGSSCTSAKKASCSTKKEAGKKKACSEKAGEKKSCDKKAGEKKACCKKGDEKKACCKKGDEKKSCDKKGEKAGE